MAKNKDEKYRKQKNEIPSEEAAPDYLEMIDLDAKEDMEEQEEGFSFNVFHLIFLGLLVLIVLLLVKQFGKLGTFVDIRSVGTVDEVEEENFDNIMPLLDEQGYLVHQDVDTILLFGNDPFADDRGSSSSLPALIEQKTGAKVINCAISGSYQSAEELLFDPVNHPKDAYIPYWMIVNTMDGSTNDFPEEAAATLGDAASPDARIAYDNLLAADLDDVDVCILFYDESDYFADRPIHYDNDYQDLTAFVGSMGATVTILRVYHPQIRFIVVSPTYAYYPEPDGSFSDAELRSNSYGKPSDYALWEYSVCADRLGVSFLDAYFNLVNCNNASDYLTDHIHLNQQGREIIAERIKYFIDYYDKEE
jgi:hypothetical protein